MTNDQFELQRFDIVKDFFNFFSVLDLDDDLGLSISNSAPGIYHIFSKKEDGTMVHQYSLSDSSLVKLVKSIKLSTIKKIYIDTRVRSMENKLIKRNCEGIDINNFENMS